MIRRKQALLFVVVILAGCRGSGASTPDTQWQTAAGTGFTFQAPAGWQAVRGRNRISLTHGSELVQVSTFSLTKAYTDKLFVPVAAELRSRMEAIARQTGGTLNAGSSVTADGVRSHAYDVTVGSQVDEYTFVLSGKREYLLLCRRTSSSGPDVCRRLVTSFARR